MGKRSAGVLLLREERGEILLLALAGRKAYDLPKGGIEENEEVFDAAKRELKEEAGITQVQWLQKEPFELTYSLRSKDKTVYLFLGSTKQSKVTVSKEHESYRWFAVSEAKEHLPERFHPAVDWTLEKLKSISF